MADPNTEPRIPDAARTNADAVADASATAISPPQPEHQEHKASPKHRTRGLWAFDVLLYPVLNNIGVFIISVIATYLTSHGDKIGGAFGKWCYRRGEWFTDKAMKAGLSHDQADMSKMVFFSFADGTLMAPLVKMLEDRRERIAHWMDDRMGTTPDDLSVYAAEPKQSWGSVLLGRLTTSAIVVPTALALDKTGLNNTLFKEPGKRWGAQFVKSYPGIAATFPRIDFSGLFKVGVFEAFYTSVCTGGLYFFSRLFAKISGKMGKTGERESAGLAPGARELESARTLTEEAILNHRSAPALAAAGSLPERPAEKKTTLHHKAASHTDYVAERKATAAQMTHAQV